MTVIMLCNRLYWNLVVFNLKHLFAEAICGSTEAGWAVACCAQTGCGHWLWWGHRCALWDPGSLRSGHLGYVLLWKSRSEGGRPNWVQANLNSLFPIMSVHSPLGEYLLGLLEILCIPSRKGRHECMSTCWAMFQALTAVYQTSEWNQIF